MALTSPSLAAGPGGPAPLTAPYTCDGKDSWPTLAWSGVPPGTAELALYAMNMQPVEGKLFVDWALAGLDPALTGIEDGQAAQGRGRGHQQLRQTGLLRSAPTGSGKSTSSPSTRCRRRSPRRPASMRAICAGRSSTSPATSACFRSATRAARPKSFFPDKPKATNETEREI